MTRRSSLLLICALACATALIVSRSERKPEPASAPEVLRRDLILRGGRLYRPGETAAFRGFMTERYESGALKSRSVIASGGLHGVSEGWYTNGVLQVREHFNAGVSDGLRTKWHANGAKLSEVMIVRGKLEGTFRRWHEDRTLAEEIEMKQGTPHGISRAYAPDGSLIAEAKLAMGKLVEQRFWRDGK